MIDELEVINPEECKEYPGFYYYPENRNLLISKEGLIGNIKTKHLLTPYPDKKGYLQIKIDTLAYKTHRLIARTFIGRPKRHWILNHDELQVNHKDGIKINNALTNLEWCTNQENTTHAISIGLVLTVIPVLTRDIRTNEIQRFPSVKSCAEHFNIFPGVLKTRLKIGSAGCITKDWCVFKFEDNKPWPELADNEKVEDNWTFKKNIWFFRNSETNNVAIFDSLENVYKILDVPKHFHTDKNTNKDRKFKDIYVYNDWMYSLTTCPTKEDVLEYNEHKKTLPYYYNQVKVTNLKTNETVICLGILDVSKQLNINNRAIIYALENNDGLYQDYKFEKLYPTPEVKKETTFLQRSIASKGKVISIETREKLRQANLGKKQSEEAIERNRQSQLQRYQEKK